MPDLSPDAQRRFARDVVDRLRAAGFTAYWAGGCVRDQLLGLIPKDYDVATDAAPEKIRDLFGRRRTLAIGAAFGVITVLGPQDAGQIEVATFREDAAYSDGRHPDAVRFSTPEADAQRRDFTINGLFYDPVAEQVIDFVGGQDDLARRVVRAIGDPRQRIEEDKLRMLRAVRFAATYEFAIDSATMQAVQEMAGGIAQVSAERIGVELRRMLVHENRAVAVRLLHESGLLAHVIPEAADLATGEKQAAWEATLRVLDNLREPSLALALAALLHLAATGETVGEIARRLRYTNKEMERAAWLVDHVGEITQAQTMPWPRLQRLLISPGIDELLALDEAKSGADSAPLAHCRAKLALPEHVLNPPPLVTGNDLKAAGFRPGPQFRDLLESVRDAQLEGRIASKEEAMALVEQLIAGRTS